jgi:hypothetical protein
VLRSGDTAEIVMREIISASWNGMLGYSWHILFASAICVVLEMIASSSRCSLASRIRGAVFWAAYIVITASFFAVFNAL